MKLSKLKEKYPELKKVISSVEKTDGIKKLYPPQEEAVKKGLLDGKNLVLSMPTAGGKTLVAELAMLKTVLEGGKAIYIVPLRAIASEKFAELKEKYSKIAKIGISTGEFDSEGTSLGKYDILIVTVEKMDSLMRHSPDWLKDIKLVALDEVHLLDSAHRGPTLEMVITRLKNFNPQFLALSATIQNSDELAKWMDAELIESQFRPVDLSRGIFVDGEVAFKEKDDLNLGQIIHSPAITLALDTVKNGAQSLVFVNTRRSSAKQAELTGSNLYENLSTKEKKELSKLSKKILNVLDRPTRQCKRLANCVRKGTAFHHAGLHSKQRSLIEENFKQNLIKVICATPTLCLPYNTRVSMANGEVRKIGEIVNSEENPSVLSTNLKTLKGGHGQITSKGKRRTNKLIHIKTRTGKEIHCTPNHPLLTLSGGYSRWKKAKNIKADDLLATSRHLKKYIKNTPPNPVSFLPKKFLRVTEPALFSKVVQQLTSNFKSKKALAAHYSINEAVFYKYLNGSNTMPLSLLLEMGEDAGYNEEDILSKIYHISWGNKKGASPQTKIKIPTSLGKDLVKFIGYVITDGCITPKKSWGSESFSIDFASSDLKKINRFKKTVARLFEKVPNTKESFFKDGVYHANFVSKPIGTLLVNMGLPAGRKAHRVRLPAFMFSLEGELIKELLSTMWECDGYVSKKRSAMEYYSSSKGLVQDLQLLLLRLGIVSRIVKKKKRKPTTVQGRKITAKHSHYTLLVSGKFAEKLADFIGVPLHNSSSRTYELDQADITKLLPDIRKETNTSTYKLNKAMGLDFWKFENGARPVRSTLQKLSNYFENANSEKTNILKRLAYSDIYWDEVVSVKSLNKQAVVYDIEVENFHNFIANGFIVHNSAGVNLPGKRVIIRDYRRYGGYGLKPIPVLEIHQMFGRAGRPKYDKEGEAVLIARNMAEYEELWDHYIEGRPEPITSKLGVEPILRMHVLGVIAECPVTRDKLFDFFGDTFYAYQYGNIERISNLLDRVLDNLFEWKFIDYDSKNKFKPTKLGNRIAQLYLDPYTAHSLIKLLSKKLPDDIILLTLLSDTAEMRPLRGVRNSETEVYDQFEKYDLKEDQLKAFKNAVVFFDWINEASDDKIFDKYGIPPGTLRTKLNIADWLLYACSEIAKIKRRKKLIPKINALRKRLKYGVRKELLPLVRVRNIGRVRARKLYQAGIKNIKDLRKAEQKKLEKLLGKKISKKVKKAVEKDLK